LWLASDNEQFMWPVIVKRFPIPALDHNFWTRNCRKSFKVSTLLTDINCSLYTISIFTLGRSAV